METKEYIPFEATHPGGLIKDELEARGIKQNAFALDIGMPLTVLNELIQEKRSITAEIALSLEKALDIPADFWMRFQAGYELDCARIKEKNIRKTKEIEVWKLIKEYVPVSHFDKLGYFTKNLTVNISKVWDVYEVSTIDELIESYSKHLNLGFYKKSEKLINNQVNIFGWSKLAQYLAKSETVTEFKPDGKNLLIAELKELFRINVDTLSGVKALLNKYGIKFLVLEKFKQAPIDGYSFWSGTNPAVVITLRKKTLDIFAFTVLHELWHVFEHLKPNSTDEYIDFENSKLEFSDKEIEANHFAYNSFIDEQLWKVFIHENPKYKKDSTANEMRAFAEKLKIHPSIVFGRYCHEFDNYRLKTLIDREIK